MCLLRLLVHGSGANYKKRRRGERGEREERKRGKERKERKGREEREEREGQSSAAKRSGYCTVINGSCTII
jgi:hypothetical protein